MKKFRYSSHYYNWSTGCCVTQEVDFGDRYVYYSWYLNGLRPEHYANNSFVVALWKVKELKPINHEI